MKHGMRFIELARCAEGGREPFFAAADAQLRKVHFGKFGFRFEESIAKVFDIA